MLTRRFIWALLPLLLLACDSEDSTVQPPVPLTTDEQIVADCRALRDALEAYAAENGGTYGEYYISLSDLGISQMENRYSGEHEPSGLRAGSPGQIGVEPYQCNGTVVGYRITGYGRDHMLITLESLENVPADVRYAHDVTVANAFLVVDAAHRWAATNNGTYPQDLAEPGIDGKTLIDLLPNGDLLINPFDSVQSEPQDGLGLATPGAIGYMGADSGSGDIDLFVMEAYDCDGAIMLTLVPFTQHGEFVWSAAYRLRTAVEAFATASSHFPHDLVAETTPAGKTVLDLYTEISYGHPTDFLNPYTEQHYIPSIGIAAGKGAIAYQPIETAGEVTDYVITGRGVFDEIVRLGPKPAP